MKAKKTKPKKSVMRSNKIIHNRMTALLLLVLFAVVGSYLVLASHAATGEVYSGSVIVKIPGNNSNPAEGYCNWLCFKPEIKQISFYIVGNSCAGETDPSARDSCSDIVDGSTQLFTCHTFDVKSGNQEIPFGTISYRAYGPTAALGKGAFHYTLYAAAGNSCGNTYSPGSTQTPNSTVYIGPTPDCGTSLGQDCPSPSPTPTPTPTPAPNPTLSPSDRGPTGSGPSGSGASSGPAATKQTNKSNPLPTSSSQGDSKQATVEPSPFIDGGKEYQPGSDPDTLGSSATTIGKKLFSSWLLVSTIAVLVSLGGAGYWWWKRRKI